MEKNTLYRDDAGRPTLLATGISLERSSSGGSSSSFDNPPNCCILLIVILFILSLTTHIQNPKDITNVSSECSIFGSYNSRSIIISRENSSHAKIEFSISSTALLEVISFTSKSSKFVTLFARLASPTELALDKFNSKLLQSVLITSTCELQWNNRIGPFYINGMSVFLPESWRKYRFIDY